MINRLFTNNYTTKFLLGNFLHTVNNKQSETPTKERKGKKSLLFECQYVSPELAMLPVLLKLWEMRNSIGFVACIVRS